MTSPEKTEKTRQPRQNKIARLLEEYELDGLGVELEELWTAETDRRSLRELAAYFNQQLLKEQLKRTELQLVDSEIENMYRLLTDDEVSSADQTRIRRRLEQNGIDVPELMTDFATYQAIRTYLKEDRNAEYQADTSDPIDREKTNIQQLQGRIVSVTDGKLDQLQSSDNIEAGEFRTLVNIQVVCEDCNTQFDIFQFLEQGGCDCP